MGMNTKAGRFIFAVTMSLGFAFAAQAQSPRRYTGTRPYLRLTQTGTQTYDNLELLKLELLSPNNTLLASVNAVSGQSWAQAFRTAPNSQSGSKEPLPEGLWQVELPNEGTNGVEWAGGTGNYNTYWEPALGPVWTGIIPQKGFETRRQAIGIHLDANREQSPGTAGCIGIPTMAELKKFVSWFSSAQTAPRTVLVDWQLGTLPNVFSFINSGVPFNLNPSGNTSVLSAQERIQLIESEN
jgi:lysozyme